MELNWLQTTLGEACDIITDGSHQSPKSVVQGKPMASVKDLFNRGVNLESARQISQEDFERLERQGCRPKIGDVLISKDGNSALDSVCVVETNQEFVLLSSVAILRPKTQMLDPKFLKYYFMSPSIIQYLKSNFISGAAIPRVILKDFKKAQIKLPSIDRQRNASKILSMLDEKVELNRKTNQTLEEMTRSLFNSWFVNFDPVIDNALIAGANINDFPKPLQHRAEHRKESQQLVGFKSIPDDIRNLFPNKFEQSDDPSIGIAGWIPKGWMISNVGDTCSHIIDHRGKTPKKLGGDWSDSGFSAISAKNIKKNCIVRSNTIRFVNHELYKKWMKEPLKSKDILMTSEAPMGEMYFLADRADYLLSQRLYGMRADEKKTTGEYLFNWFQTDLVKADLDGRSTGTTVLGIRQTELKKVAVLLPELSLAKKFTELSGKYLLQKERNAIQSESIEKLRDTLLPKLISGEISINKEVV